VCVWVARSNSHTTTTHSPHPLLSPSVTSHWMSFVLRPSPAAAGNSRPIQPDINASNFNILNNTEIKVLSMHPSFYFFFFFLAWGRGETWNTFGKLKTFADAGVLNSSDLIGLQKQAKNCSSGNALLLFSVSLIKYKLFGIQMQLELNSKGFL